MTKDMVEGAKWQVVPIIEELELIDE
jgi:hypothetical protein